MSRQIKRRALRKMLSGAPRADRYVPYTRNEGKGEGTKRMTEVVKRRKANWIKETEETETNG